MFGLVGLETAFGFRPLLFPMYIVPFLLTLICGPSFPPKEAARFDKEDCDESSGVLTTGVLLGASSFLGPKRI